jgi:lipid A 3-O-deacylase
MIHIARSSIFLAAGLALLFSVLPAHAEPDKVFDTFTVYWENDFFAGTDRDYTNGLRLTLSTPYGKDGKSARLPAWSDAFFSRLPFVHEQGSQRAVSLSLGQNMYTPGDTQQSGVIADDRPYAGITYLAAGFHSRKDDQRTSWELDAGMIGPLSFADKTQSFVHRIINSPLDKGWSHQLHNELVVDAVCESEWRVIRGGTGQSFNYDVIPHLGGSIGTAMIYVNTGAEGRIGWNLPADFGTCPIRAGCETNTADIAQINDGHPSVHLFIDVDGRLVVRDIFLDGNTFRDSQSVEKKRYVASIMTGIALDYGRMKASYSYVLRTRQYKTQQHEQIFGAINISWTY